MLRLNLGAGNKPLPRADGWVNVDLRLGDDAHAWLACDFNVQPLPAGIAPGTVDEILASHVVEHIHRPAVPGVLAAWCGALKPGGRIALEQPDLIKCAANFLRGVASDDTPHTLQFGLWGFYGNSAAIGDGMGHCWGYWPASLTALLTQAGFTDIRETVPRVKPWAVHRDFRIEATRP